MHLFRANIDKLFIRFGPLGDYIILYVRVLHVRGLPGELVAKPP